MQFRLIEEPNHTELIARGREIRELSLLQQRFGGHNWRKLKGWARIELPSGRIRKAEVHWYECHGVGRRMLKIKKLVD